MLSTLIFILSITSCVMSGQVSRYAIRRSIQGRHRRVLGWNYPVNRNQWESKDTPSDLAPDHYVYIKPPLQDQANVIPVPRTRVTRTYSTFDSIPKRYEDYPLVVIQAPRTRVTRTYSRADSLPTRHEDYPFHALGKPMTSQKMLNGQDNYARPNELILKHMQKIIERLDTESVTEFPRIHHLYSLLKDELHHQQPHIYMANKESKKHMFLNKLNLKTEEE